MTADGGGISYAEFVHGWIRGNRGTVASPHRLDRLVARLGARVLTCFTFSSAARHRVQCNTGDDGPVLKSVGDLSSTTFFFFFEGRYEHDRCTRECTYYRPVSAFWCVDSNIDMTESRGGVSRWDVGINTCIDIDMSHLRRLAGVGVARTRRSLGLVEIAPRECIHPRPPHRVWCRESIPTRQRARGRSIVRQRLPSSHT